MSVEEQMLIVSKLAQMDMRLIELARVIKKGPSELAQYRKRLTAAETGLTEATAARTKAEEGRATAETELATTKRRLEQSRQNATRITSLEQQEASKIELSALEKRQKQYEDEIVSTKEAAELQALEVDDLEKEVTAAKQAMIETEARVPETVKEAKTQALSLWKKHEKQVKKLEPLVKRMYDVAISKGGNPMCTVIDKVCQSCHSMVPPQHLVETEQGKTIHVCSRCRRIIGKVMYSED